MNTLEIEFCSSIYVSKEKFLTNESKNFFANVAVYYNLGGKKNYV